MGHPHFSGSNLCPSACAATEGHKRLKSIQMADTLYLSLWYPNLRLEALPDKLIGGAGRLCRAWRRGEGVCGDGLAGELERDAGVPAGLWAHGAAD